MYCRLCNKDNVEEISTSGWKQLSKNSKSFIRIVNQYVGHNPCRLCIRKNTRRRKHFNTDEYILLIMTNQYTKTLTKEERKKRSVLKGRINESKNYLGFKPNHVFMTDEEIAEKVKARGVIGRIKLKARILAMSAEEKEEYLAKKRKYKNAYRKIHGRNEDKEKMKARSAKYNKARTVSNRLQRDGESDEAFAKRTKQRLRTAETIKRNEDEKRS